MAPERFFCFDKVLYRNHMNFASEKPEGHGVLFYIVKAVEARDSSK
jgi:hypothetical protein